MTGWTNRFLHPERLLGEGVDPRLEPAFALSAAFVALLVAALVVQTIGLSPADGLAALVLVTSVLVWWSAPVVSLVIAALAFVDLDGFVLNVDGQLTWHGGVDVARLALLAGVALAVAVVRTNRLLHRHISTSVKGIGHG